MSDHNMAVWERAQQERRERVQRILETAFVVGVELRPSGFVRREWMTILLEGDARITGEVFKGRPVIRYFDMPAEAEDTAGRWRDGEDLVPGTPLHDLARAVVHEALRAHAGAARRREATA